MIRRPCYLLLTSVTHRWVPSWFTVTWTLACFYITCNIVRTITTVLYTTYSICTRLTIWKI